LNKVVNSIDIIDGMYAHKSIKRFSLDGEIYDDSHIIRLKDQYYSMIVAGMKSDGYVPRYDIDTDFTISYNGRTFNFEISIYGVYVGKRIAECIEGIDKNRPVMATSTQRIKSEEVC
jgi:hypothetical protein